MARERRNVAGAVQGLTVVCGAGAVVEVVPSVNTNSNCRIKLLFHLCRLVTTN